MGRDGGSSLLQRFRHQELKLAGFVTSGGQSGAVIALDPNLRTPKMRREPLCKFNGCRQVRQSASWKSINVEHHRDLMQFRSCYRVTFVLNNADYLI